MGKSQVENGDENADLLQESVKLTYEEKLKFLNPIAKPLAGKKLTKKIYKLIKSASKDKSNFYDGLKNVQQALRKGEKGLVIIAGDVYPVDLITHLPAVCEDRDLPYCYVPSRRDIGSSMGVKRTVVTVMIKEKDDYSEAFQEIVDEIKLLPCPL